MKALASITAIILLVAASPVALVTWGKLNNLATVDWIRLFTRPDDGSFLLGLLTLIGWLAWASATCSLVGETIAQLRHRPLSLRLPGTAWFAPAAVALIGAVATLGTIGTAVSVFGHPNAAVSFTDTSTASDGAATTWVGSPAEQVATSSDAAELTDTTDALAASGTATSGTPRRTVESLTGASEPQPYLVRPGDDLWSLAETYLGSGARWGEILTENDSSLLGPLAELKPGTVLILPATSGVTPASVPAPDMPANVEELTPSHPLPQLQHHEPASIVVHSGDTLWDLAETHLGDAYQWPQLHEANQNAVVNPDLIYPGQELRLPSSVVDSLSVTEGSPTTESPSTVEDLPTAEDSSVTDVRSTAGSASTVEDSRVTLEGGASMPDYDGSPAPTDGRVSDVGKPTFERQTTEDDATAPESLSTAERLLAILGPLGPTAAAAVLLACQARRAAQLRHRALGRAVPTLEEAITRFETALTKSAATGATPEQFHDGVMTYVVLGVSDDEVRQQVELDLANAGVVCLYGDENVCNGLLGTITTQLLRSCSRAELTMHCVVGEHQWLSNLDDGLITWFDDTDALLAEATRTALERLAHLQTYETVLGKQTKPEYGAAWIPQFYALSAPNAVFDAHVDFAAAGITVLVAGGSPQASSNYSIEVGADRAGTVHPFGQRFVANVLTPDTEASLADYATTYSSPSLDPAPWWDDHVPDAPDDLLEPSPSLSVTFDDINLAFAQQQNGGHVPNGTLLACDTAAEVNCVAPTLLVLGEVSLVGCSGKLPDKAIQQCVEYAGWLLEHPNTTSVAMADALLVSEGTRRSNMSRLRGWLGATPDGEPYLPEAYSGRMRLHPMVTSDWEQFQAFIGAGINKASTASLIRALSQVRGVPLQDAPPGLWGWAANWRNNMVGAIRDAAVVLGSRALDAEEYPLTEWALQRGELVVSHDDLLTMIRLRLEHALGHRAEVDRIVLGTVRFAREMSFDISKELGQVISHVTRPDRGGSLAEMQSVASHAMAEPRSVRELKA
jgi:nucleoid-associated protein YgaU